MNLNLENRTVVVTGASRGIGAEVCETFAREGARVVAIARGRHDLDLLTEKMKQDSFDLTPVVADVSTRDGCYDAKKSVMEKFDTVDVVVHNAGGANVRGSIHSLRDEDWFETYRSNVMSALWIAQAFWPELKLSTQPRMAFISSTTAQEPGYFDPHYSSSKSALLNFAKHLSRKMSEDGILVNTLLPGPIRTPGLTAGIESMFSDSDRPEDSLQEELSLISSKIPLGKVGTPADVASAVAFLCSGINNWITGATLRIDGGKNLSI